LGSYVAAAIAAQNLSALAWAIGTMIVLILLIDQFFWKPLVTVADRYKLELSAGEERRFWLVDLWRAASLARYAEALVSRLMQRVDHFLAAATAVQATGKRRAPSRTGELVYNGVLVIVIVGLVVAGIRFVLGEVGIREVGYAVALGFATGGRVLV